MTELSFRVPQAWATGLLKGVTRLGSNAVLIPLVVALGGYMLLRRKDWRAAALLVAALVGANAFYQVTKPLVARARPPEPLHLVGITGYSFPSGHATASIAVWGAVALVLTAGRARRLKAAIWICAGVIPALVAFSGVYLGVHWWTDVVGGLAIGGAWLCVLVAVTLTGRGKAAASNGSAPLDQVVKA